MRAIEARLLSASEREEALAYLKVRARTNLLLTDLVARVGKPASPGEVRSQVAVALRAGEICGIVAIHPSVIFDAGIEAAAIEALLPFLEALRVGLVKCERAAVDVLWPRLRGSGRREAVLDRLETAYALDPPASFLHAPTEGGARPASDADLERLVHAARESLREESRPDPFTGDVRGFRRWVKGRVPRARVVERGGDVAFVGYADVRRRDGWLLQGIYTWPEHRRRGLAAQGTSDICREAFLAEADHVQLAVVEGNDGARRLYEGLGFAPFAELRTLLFH